ncbi:uncharacterized protein VTP21DRAFT_9037 [Calcarisporiella thermophila]|uniref:uncharacterized protein n=1 Tax=Calcarisporiella thermophila TaxID=911321 RepID=UPI00374313FB
MSNSFFGFDTTLPESASDNNHLDLTSALSNLTLEDDPRNVETKWGYSGQDDHDFDKLNDETFGDLGDIEKDFDFAGNTKHVRNCAENRHHDEIRESSSKETETAISPTSTSSKEASIETPRSTDTPRLKGVWNDRMIFDYQAFMSENESKSLDSPLYNMQASSQSQNKDLRDQKSRHSPAPRLPTPQHIIENSHSKEHPSFVDLTQQHSPNQSNQQQRNLHQQIRPPYSLENVWAEQERLAAEAIERERRRQERSRHMADLAKYNGIMSMQDKEHIHRIHVYQLQTDDPLSEDYYFQAYNHRLQQVSGAGWTEQDEIRQRISAMLNDARHTQQLPQRRHVPSQFPMKPASLENTLGAPAYHSIKSPRKILQVASTIGQEQFMSGEDDVERQQLHARPTTSTATTPMHDNDRRQLLRWIEDMYAHLLLIEQLRRQQPIPIPGREHESHIAILHWRAEYLDTLQKIWVDLRVTDPIGSHDHDHAFIRLLSIGKGKKLVGRVLPLLTPQQLLTVLTVLVANFEMMDVCRPNAPEADLFVNTVLPPLLRFVAEAPFRVVIGLVYLFLERNNVNLVMRSKVGLAFLTMFLSRAEILKQGGGVVQGMAIPSDRERLQWQEIFNHLFSTIRHHLPTLFSPAYSSGSQDDLFVWQFLAAVAVGASTEQQQVLVVEIREKLLETIMHANPSVDAKKLANVNLFLHALGVDASQLYA